MMKSGLFLTPEASEWLQIVAVGIVIIGALAMTGILPTLWGVIQSLF